MFIDRQVWQWQLLCVFLNPGYVPKSGKHSPGLSRFWSGQAGAVKRGMEIGAFAEGDLERHTAFHLSAMYFCIDTEKVWVWILERYALRFQIEFIFRDAKQFTGLTHCQSTDKTKLENHFNLALGAVSVAKTAPGCPSKRNNEALSQWPNSRHTTIIWRYLNDFRSP